MGNVLLLGAELLRIVSPDTPHAAALSWISVMLYGILAQVAAIISTVEIGPNLLAAVTSIIGLATVITQAIIAARIKRVDQLANRNRKEIKRAHERADEQERKTNGK